MRRYGLFTFGLTAAVLVAGCSGDSPTLAPVSGVVKLDGKPYARAVVSFQPIGGKDPMKVGKGSMGVTDENGKYTLVYDGRENGAVVGKHTVRISTQPGSGVSEKMPDTGTPDGIVGAKPDFEFDPIPVTWNEKSDKTFDVPPGGTDQANFDITADPVIKAKMKKR